MPISTARSKPRPRNSRRRGSDCAAAQNAAVGSSRPREHPRTHHPRKRASRYRSPVCRRPAQTVPNPPQVHFGLIRDDQGQCPLASAWTRYLASRRSNTSLASFTRPASASAIPRLMAASSAAKRSSDVQQDGNGIPGCYRRAAIHSATWRRFRRSSCTSSSGKGFLQMMQKYRCRLWRYPSVTLGMQLPREADNKKCSYRSQ